MTQIIKDRRIVEDDWAILRLSEGDAPSSVRIPQGKVLLPLSVWQAQGAQLGPEHIPGVWFASHEQAKMLEEDPNRFAVIAIDFPKFADGRGYSIAYNLRHRRAYRGELRAIGDVLRDQMFYMQRVGFDAFAPRPDKPIEEALKGLSDFSTSYQAAWDQKLPLFRRVIRTGAPA